MSNKQIIDLASSKVKIRRTWGTLRPVTRVKGSKRIYRRWSREEINRMAKYEDA